MGGGGRGEVKGSKNAKFLYVLATAGGRGESEYVKLHIQLGEGEPLEGMGPESHAHKTHTTEYIYSKQNTEYRNSCV